MTSERVREFRKAIVSHSVAASGCFVLFELMTAVRDPYWIGLYSWQVIGLALALPVYLVAIVLLSFFVFVPGFLNGMSGGAERVYRLGCLIFGVIALWSLLEALGQGYSDVVWTSDWPLPLAACGVLIASNLLDRHGVPRTTVAAVWAGAFISAMVVMLCADSMLTIRPERVTNSVRASIMWLLVALVFGHGFALLTRRAKGPLIAYAVMTIMPIALSQFIPTLRMQRVEPVGPSVLLITSTEDADALQGVSESAQLSSILYGRTFPVTATPKPLPTDVSLARIMAASGYATPAAFLAAGNIASLEPVLGDFELPVLFSRAAPERAGIFAAAPRLHALFATFEFGAHRRLLHTSSRLVVYAQAYAKEHRSATWFLWVHFSSALPGGDIHDVEYDVEMAVRDVSRDDSVVVVKAVLPNAQPDASVPITLQQLSASGTGLHEAVPIASCEIVDIAPTVANLVGIAKAPDWTGTSHADHWKTQTAPKESAPTP